MVAWRSGAAGLLVGVLACGGAAAGGGADGDVVPARRAVDGLTGRDCHYVDEPGSAPPFDGVARLGTRGNLALWGRGMEAGDSVELSVRYGDDGRLEWVRVVTATVPGERAASLVRLIRTSLADSARADWGVRIHVVGGDVTGTEPSVVCPPERDAVGSMPAPPAVTRRDLSELYRSRGRRFMVRVTLDEQGRIMDVAIAHRTGLQSVDQLLLDYIRGSRFEPKLHDGFGVATVYEFPVRIRRR